MDGKCQLTMRSRREAMKTRRGTGGSWISQSNSSPCVHAWWQAALRRLCASHKCHRRGTIHGEHVVEGQTVNGRVLATCGWKEARWGSWMTPLDLESPLIRYMVRFSAPGVLI